VVQFLGPDFQHGEFREGQAHTPQPESVLLSPTLGCSKVRIQPNTGLINADRIVIAPAGDPETLVTSPAHAESSGSCQQ
jgi:hypothetical protein